MRPMAPREGTMQPRPLMDFGEQLDGTAFFPEQMQVYFAAFAATSNLVELCSTNYPHLCNIVF